MEDLFFVDSNVIIEGLKGNKKANEIFKQFLDSEIKIAINPIVYSEVIYKLTYKHLFDLEEIHDILIKSSYILAINYFIINFSYDLMKKYNLKPNDALILATCKHYNIKYLISLDEDFKKPCEKEGIVLIDSAEKLKEILNN
jgi:predicted nucleic acid-binding protein